MTSSTKALLDAPWKQTILAIIVFLLLTILFTYPLTPRINTHIPGYRDDIYQFYWNNWWFGEAVSRGVSPWRTDMLWYPNGSSLVFGTNRFVCAALALPLEPMLGDIVAYNLVIIFSFVVSALGMFLFVRELTGNAMAGFASAFVYTFNPWKFQKLQCHHNFLSTWFFGFALWMFVRIVRGEEKKRKHGILLGAMLGVMAYESMYLLDFMLLSLLAVAIWMAIFEKKNFWDPKTLGGLVYGLAAFIIVSLPMALIVLDGLPEYGGLPNAEGAERYSNDLLELVWPSPLPYTAFGTHPSEIFTPSNQVYGSDEENFGPIGWIVLPLAVWGWLTGRKKYGALADALAVGAVIFAVLSLGPVLHIAGNSTGVPMPYSLLSWLPPFGMVRTPNRFLFLTFTLIAPLVGFAIQKAANVKLAGRKGLLTAALIALILIDYMPHGSGTHDQQDIPENIIALAEVDGDFAVMPIGYRFIDNMELAPFHGKPSIAGYAARHTLYSSPIQNFPIHLVYDLYDFAENHPDAENLPEMVDTTRKILQAWNIGAIIHNGPPERLEAISRVLGGAILARDGEHGTILLSYSEPSSQTLTFTAENLQPMNRIGIHHELSGKQLWAPHAGFRIAVPDSLMPEGKIAIATSSAAQYPGGDLQRLHILCNRELLGSFDLTPETQKIELELPGNFRRLPVNFINFVSERIPAESITERIPFDVEALSGNRHAGGLTYLNVAGRELLSLGSGGDGLIFVSFDAVGNPLATATYQSNTGSPSGEPAAFFQEAGNSPWIFVISSGNPDEELLGGFVKTLGEQGYQIDKEDLLNNSFIYLIDTQQKQANLLKNSTGYVQMINGKAGDDRPAFNIEFIHLK